MANLVTLYPNADGDALQWSNGGATLPGVFQRVRSRDTSWRTTSTLNKNDLFQIDDMPAVAGAIVQVDISFYARRETASNANVALWYKLGANTVATADQVVNTYDWVLYTVTAISRPGGGTWTVADLNALQIGYYMNTAAVQVSVDQVYLTVSYLLAPSPATGYIPREAPSQKLNEYRRPREKFKSAVPLSFLDRELLDGLAWSHRRGPAVASIGPGWKRGKTSRRPSRISSIALDFNAFTPKSGASPVVLEALDRKYIDATLWDVMVTTRSSAAEAQGVPRMLSGAMRRVVRPSGDYVEDPSDQTIRQILTDGESIADGGTVMESIDADLVLRDSFQSGLTGWTTVVGTITTDTSLTWWDLALSATGSIKLVAGAVNRAEMTHVTTSANTWAGAPSRFGRVSISYFNDNVAGSRLVWQLQRSSDSKWFRDSDGTWQVAATDNFMASSTVRVRGISANYFVPVGAETFTIHVFAELNATMHVFDVQIGTRRWVTNRFRNDGSQNNRARAALFAENFAVIRQDLAPSARGTLGIEFIPDWTTAEMNGSGVVPYLVYAVDLPNYLDANIIGRLELYYDAPNSNFVFRMYYNGTSYAATSQTITLARGTVYRIVARWTGADGELGLAARTLSCFAAVSGSTLIKGTDVVRGGDQAPVSYGWLMYGHTEQTMDPTSFSPSLWLRADAGVYKDAGVTLAIDGDTVQQWNDQSGNVRNFTQAVAGNRPTFKTAIVNGLPVVRFAAAATSFLSSAGNLSTMLGVNGVGHIFIVYRVSGPLVNGAPLILDTSIKAGLVCCTVAAGNAVDGQFAFNVVVGVAATQQQAAQPGSWWVGEWIHRGATSLLSSLLGANSAGVASGTTDATGPARIGQRPDGGVTYFTGDIAEVMIFNAELTVSNFAGSLNHIQEYFQRKYAQPFSSNPLPVSRGGGASSTACNGRIRRLRITQHVLADDELTRLF